jgi:hypothetical protein
MFKKTRVEIIGSPKDSLSHPSSSMLTQWRRFNDYPSLRVRARKLMAARNSVPLLLIERMKI